MPARVRGLEAEAGGGRPSTSRPGPAGINQCSTPPGLAGTTPSWLPAPQHQHPCAPGALSVLTSLCNLWPAHGNPPPRLLYLIFCLLPARSLPSTPRLTTSAPRHTTPSPIRTTLRTIPHHACRHLPIYHCLARLCNRIASLSTSGPRTPPLLLLLRQIDLSCLLLLAARSSDHRRHTHIGFQQDGPLLHRLRPRARAWRYSTHLPPVHLLTRSRRTASRQSSLQPASLIPRKTRPSALSIWPCSSQPAPGGIPSLVQRRQVPPVMVGFENQSSDTTASRVRTAPLFLSVSSRRPIFFLRSCHQAYLL